MANYSYINSGIPFEVESDAKIAFGKITNMDGSISHGHIVPLVNAVEIDWNNAQLELGNELGTRTVNTTGELLSVIKNISQINVNGSKLPGAQGAQGPQGISGVQGSIGVQGTKGQLGNQGPIGAQGAMGFIGAQGSRGQGVQGSMGYIGVQGTKGEQGLIGAQGTIGQTGTFDSSELENYATKSFVNEEITKVVGAAPEAFDTLKEIADKLSDNDDVVSALATQIASKAATDDVYTKAEADAAFQAKGEYLTEHQSLEGYATETYVNGEVETIGTRLANVTLALTDNINTISENTYTKTEINNAGFLTEHQDISGKANVGDAYTKAEADAAFQAKGEYLTEHQSLEGYATEAYVNNAVEAIVGAAPENFDTLKELADVMEDLKVVDVEAVPAVEGEHFTQEEIDAAQEGDEAYGKTTDDWKVEPVEAVEEVSHNMTISEFVTTTMQEVNEKAEVQALQTRMAAIERAMARMDANAYQAMVNSLAATETLETLNTVTIEEGTIADIIIPETTKSKTVTGELDPNSTLTLNSRYGVTINNTSAESTNLEVNAPAVDGYNAATITLKDGEFDTVTLTDASLTVQDNATVQNVVITEDTTKTLTINAKFEEGATVTSNSEAPITLNNKNGAEEAVSVTLNAPGSTVTLSGGQWVTISGAVSQNTLIIKKNAKVQNLDITEGNVVVEVARQADIANVITGTITLAEGCNIDYIHDEVTNDNSSVLTSTGEHTLTEDINKGGRFAPGTFASDDIVWNLNGHNMTFTNTAGYANFLLRGTLHLEINGNGTITNNAGDYGFWTSAAGAKLVVNGGTYYAATHVLYAQQGTIEVNGGEFHLTDEATAEKDANGNFKFLLNCLDANYTAGTANIVVRGGTFYGFNPAESYGEPLKNGEVANFVAQGYESVETGTYTYTDGDNNEVTMKIYTVNKIVTETT